MKKTKEIKINDRTVTVRELTVAEVRNWELDIKSENMTYDLISEALIKGASLADAVRMSDVTMEDMDTMTPTDVESIIDGCREVNPHFFALRENLLRMGEKLSPGP